MGYQTVSIKQLVKHADPNPGKDISYQFSNGRVFYEKRRPPGTVVVDEPLAMTGDLTMDEGLIMGDMIA